jgi:major membrane immunogen (membrane-anchored lipoprotein)
MKRILFSLIAAPLILGACASTELTMSLGNMRLINSSADPQKVMDFANQICKDDFYLGASFISKAGKDYRFKCVKADENEVLVPIPGLKPISTK